MTEKEYNEQTALLAPIYDALILIPKGLSLIAAALDERNAIERTRAEHEKALWEHKHRHQ